MAGATVDGHMQFEPISGGTRLSWDWKVTIGGLGQLAGPLIVLIGRQQERTIWTSLKRHLEDSSAVGHWTRSRYHEVVIGPGQIGQAIARQGCVAQHVLLADLHRDNYEAVVEVLANPRYDVSLGTVDPSSCDAIQRT